jgi:signal transduction histidine kinase
VNLVERRDNHESVLVTAVMLVALFGVWAELHFSPTRTPSPVGGYALALGAAGSMLLLHRRSPVLAAAACLALCYAYRAAGYPGFAPALMVFVACFTLANSRGLAYGLVPAVVAWLIPALPPHTLSLSEAGVAMPPVGMALVALVGEANRRRRIEYEARLRETAATAQALLGRRMAEERLRMARELHDVLAHTISVVAVQAGVALDALDDSPEQARQAMVAVRGAAKQALPELRATLEMLRGENELGEDGSGDGREDGTHPQPGLAELPGLVRQARDSGLTVTFEIGAGLESASPLLQLTAYRIVQESLTNVRKHAPNARTYVTLRCEDDELRIDVLDEGPAADLPTQPATQLPGFGLLGMRERAESLGGGLESAPRPTGGFAVRARLPWTAATGDGTR